MLSDDESTWFLPVPPVSQLPQGWWWRWRLGGGGLDSKTVENGGWAGGALVAGRAGVLGLLGGLLGSGGWAGELLRHGVELEALGTGDGSLFHVEGPGTDLEEKTGGTGVKTLAGWFV